MEPAATIIGKLGGVNAVAAHLRLHRTRVSSWQRSRDAGGTGGAIPQRHIPTLLELAKALGVRLALRHFFPSTAGAA